MKTPYILCNSQDKETYCACTIHHMSKIHRVTGWVYFWAYNSDPTVCFLRIPDLFLLSCIKARFLKDQKESPYMLEVLMACFEPMYV